MYQYLDDIQIYNVLLYTIVNGYGEDSKEKIREREQNGRMRIEQNERNKEQGATF